MFIGLMITAIVCGLMMTATAVLVSATSKDALGRHIPLEKNPTEEWLLVFALFLMFAVAPVCWLLAQFIH